MNEKYQEAKETITRARKQLEEITREPEITNGSIEDREAYDTLQDLLDRLEESERALNYLGSATQEGTLIMDPARGKFYIGYYDGGQSYLLSCGSSLELFMNDQWHIGRVEANSAGVYYFYGEGRPELAHGMRARLRIIEE